MTESSAKSLEVWQGEDEQWYWHAKGGNNEIVASGGGAGEGYTRREDAVRAAEDVFPQLSVPPE